MADALATDWFRTEALDHVPHTSAPGVQTLPLPAGFRASPDPERTLEIPPGTLFNMHIAGNGLSPLSQASYALWLASATDYAVARSASCPTGEAEHLRGALVYFDANPGSPNEALIRGRYRYDFAGSGARQKSAPDQTIFAGASIVDPNQCIPWVLGSFVDSAQDNAWNRVLAVPTLDAAGAPHCPDGWTLKFRRRGVGRCGRCGDGERLGHALRAHHRRAAQGRYGDRRAIAVDQRRDTQRR